MSDPVLIERDGAIATVTLNNPDKMNALGKPMWKALRDGFCRLAEDSSLRCVVVRGAGTKAFAAGADITEFEAERADPGQARAYDALLHEALTAIDRCPHPTVAMIHGACVGGGLQIAAQCDLRIAGVSAKFGAPVGKLGMAMPCAEVESITRLVGMATMLEILLEGRILDAQEALAKNIVTRLVPDDRVEAEALAAARRIADGAPRVARWHKAYVRRIMEPRPIVEAEREAGYFYFATRDFREGLAAFLGKRKPEFHGE